MRLFISGDGSGLFMTKNGLFCQLRLANGGSMATLAALVAKERDKGSL